jgi:hypothetical protein
MTIYPHRTGLILAALLGTWHLLWSLLVALGWAQGLINFIFWIHFIRPVYIIENFEIGRALLLIAVTSAIGYSVGWSFAMLWNKFHK